MSDKAPDFWRSLQDVATRAANEQSRLIQSYLDVWFPPKQGARSQGQTQTQAQAPATAAAGEVARSTGERTVRLVRDWTNLTTSYYRGLFELGRSYAEAVAGEVFGNRPAGSAGAGAVIELTAPIGKEATASFFVENKRTSKMDVALEVSPFSDLPGADGFTPSLAIEPAQFALGPGEERQVTLRLPLDAAQFKPGLCYVATLVNRGDPDTRLMLRINALDAKQASAARTGGAQEAK